MTVMGADVALTWLMTSACPVNKMTVVGADVAYHVAADVSLTQPVNRVRPDPVTVNPTRITRPGQPGQRSTRPGQRPTGSNRSTRPGQHSPAALSRAATRFHTRRPFWWRVRAREMEFLGNFGTYRFVLKFPTMWYIDLAHLKLLQT